VLAINGEMQDKMECLNSLEIVSLEKQAIPVLQFKCNNSFHATLWNFTMYQAQLEETNEINNTLLSA